MEISKKLRHIGLSSEHNEYMAMFFANQANVWMRQLYMEMGLEGTYARLLGKGLPSLPGALPGLLGTLPGLPGPYLAYLALT